MIPRQPLKGCGVKITKLKVNIILLLLGVEGRLIVWHLFMASCIYMQNLNEISEAIFSILYGNIKKLKPT